VYTIFTLHIYYNMSNVFSFFQIKKKTVLKLFFYLFFNSYSYYFFCIHKKRLQKRKKNVCTYIYFIYNCIIIQLYIYCNVFLSVEYECTAPNLAITAQEVNMASYRKSFYYIVFCHFYITFLFNILWLYFLCIFKC